MHAANRSRGHEFEAEIAIGDGVERICRRPVEAERLCGHGAVDRERGAGERRRAERTFVEPPAAIGEPRAVATDHLDIGEKMVAEGHGLGDLQMGIARHHRRGMALGLLQQCRLKGLHVTIRALDGGAEPKANVGGDLVVARARRMQTAGVWSDDLGQPRLDIHVDVFAIAPKREPSALDLGEDLP